MAVYFKFKSAKDYDSIPIDGHFISVGNLKEKIFESKHLGRGTDFDLVVSNAQTNEEYLDEAMLVPKNTSVLVRRVPGRPRMPIVTEREEPKLAENQIDNTPQPKNSYQLADSSLSKFPEESEWDEFGNDLYAIPEVQQIQPNQMHEALPNKADEDSKIKALIDTTALDWQRQTHDGYGAGRGFGRGMGGRMLLGRGFGRGGMERKTPPHGYICHRCKVPGHFIQHCPTNGDPSFDVKRVKAPTGIPKSMLMATPDGSYALPSGAVAVLKPNEAAFEKEIEGLPSTRPISDLPPELRCPLCKEVMKDAVLTSKCCFSSFCDKCIRDYIISKAMCVCGVTNVLADDLLPNKTLRETINRILETTTSSAENAGSCLQVQDMESAQFPRPKAPSPTLSATAREEHTQPPKEEAPKVDEAVSGGNAAVNLPQESLDRNRPVKNVDQSEVTPESMSMKEPNSQGSVPLAEEEVQQKLAAGEQGKKKKKKKIRLPNGPDMQWRMAQDLSAENSLMPFGPTAFNPYWHTGMPWGMEGYVAAPYGTTVPYMGYTPSPFDIPFGGMLPQDPFGAQGYAMPVVPSQRDYPEYGIGSNPAPLLSREEFEARKADLRRKRESERRSERECSKDREVSTGIDVAPTKSKPRLMSQAASMGRAERASSLELHRESDLARLSPRAGGKRKPDWEDLPLVDPKPDRKQKGSVFSRISFPESGEASKKRKPSEAMNGFKDNEIVQRPSISGPSFHDDRRPPKGVPSGNRRSVHEHDLSDDEYHFKRKRSRHEIDEWERDEEDGGRGLRDRGRDHEHGHERSIKHR